ncbi:MAG TPA: hypothetical protein VHO66_09610 [Ruminiclostridium sp.]|nr:hypothetical protein [Ruminiclostridium sp.]
MKNFFELLNDERKANDILPMKACTGGAVDYACTGGVDADQCSGIGTIDDCGSWASDFSTCYGNFEHDERTGPV